MEVSARKEEKLIEVKAKDYGVALRAPYSEHTGGRAFLTLVRGVLIFLAVFGTVGGLTASFGLKFNPVSVGVSLLVISVAVAFTYYNKVTFYAGYVGMFLIFLILYVIAYIYINSGFQAFLNQVYTGYSDFFRLPSTRETTEYIADRSVTVPAAMLFTGAGFAILLNISISAYMDIFTTFLLTFLPLQLAFYIDIIPPMPYLIMLIAVYITVTMLGRSGRFRLPYRYKKSRQYSYRRTGRGDSYEYLASGQGMVQMAVMGIAVSAVLMLLLSGMFGGQFATKNVSNRVKDTTDRYVKTLAQGGIASLFNRYQATGGISHGRLGGISSVAPDYETDILVRMMPVSTGSGRTLERMYLKAYTGAWYENNQFLPLIPDKSGGSTVQPDEYIPVGATYMDTDRIAYMKLWLMNVDADNVYDYRPYYTLYSGSGRNEKASGVSDMRKSYAVNELGADKEAAADREALNTWAEQNSGETGDNTYYELIYTPYAESGYYEPNPGITDEYEEYVYENYLGIADSLRPVVEEIAVEAGLKDISVKPADVSIEGISDEYRAYMASQQERLRIAGALKKYYEENYSYSMLPGATPIGRDTVEYFLSELKRGYCVHFAASAAVILRSMGIPTRYIEGYVIDPSDVMEGTAYVGQTRDWLVGMTGDDEQSIDGETAVVDIEIPDANAHAWIEIYIDGYGWIPYEMTPPSDEEDIRYGGLADFFAGIFSRTVRGADANNADEGVISGDTGVGNLPEKLVNSRLSQALGSVDFLVRPIIIITLVIAGMVLLYLLAVRLWNRLRLRHLISSGEYGEALLIRYRELLKYLRKKKILETEYPTVKDVVDVLKPFGTDVKLYDAVSMAAFGVDKPDYDTYRRLSEDIKRIMTDNRH